MIKKINIDDIRVNLITFYPTVKLIKLEESPHYQFLLGNIEPYIEYLKIAKQPDHSVEKFEKLMKEFDYLSKGNKYKYIECVEKDDIYVIIDGFHRSCILLHKEEKEIDVFIR